MKIEKLVDILLVFRIWELEIIFYLYKIYIFSAELRSSEITTAVAARESNGNRWTCGLQSFGSRQTPLRRSCEWGKYID